MQQNREPKAGELLEFELISSSYIGDDGKKPWARGKCYRSGPVVGIYVTETNCERTFGYYYEQTNRPFTTELHEFMAGGIGQDWRFRFVGSGKQVCSAGCICKKCNAKNDYAEPNQSDGTYLCFECRA